MNMAKAPDTDTISSSEVNAGHLRAFIERIERLEEEKKALASDIKEVYGEAKAQRLRREDHAKDRIDPKAGPRQPDRRGDGARSLSGRAGDELSGPPGFDLARQGPRRSLGGVTCGRKRRAGWSAHDRVTMISASVRGGALSAGQWQ